MYSKMQEAVDELVIERRKALSEAEVHKAEYQSLRRRAGEIEEELSRLNIRVYDRPEGTYWKAAG